MTITINPYDYLHDVLERLPEHPVNQLHELLPPNWKPAKVKTGVENKQARSPDGYKRALIKR